MTIILAFILYIVGFCLIAGWIFTKTSIPNNQTMVLAVLFLVYTCIAVGFAVLAYLWGDFRPVLYTLLLFLIVAAVGNMIMTFLCSRHEICVQHIVLFLLYVLAILMVSLITRRTRTETVLQLELFAAVKSALTKGSLEELNHMILNVIMFMPLGYLFVQMHPHRLGNPVPVVGIGVVLSTFIEISQLVFRRGNCDVDDILANSIGAFLGLVIFKIINRNDG